MSGVPNQSLVQLDQMLADLEQLLGETNPDPRQLGMVRIALNGWTSRTTSYTQA
jgi:hypothetical protein